MCHMCKSLNVCVCVCVDMNPKKVHACNPNSTQKHVNDVQICRICINHMI